MDAALPERLVECRLSVDREAILAYAAITDDYNPIHVDPEFAKSTPLGGVIAHGMLSLNALWQALRRTLGTASVERVTLDIRFLKPVRVNDRIVAGGARLADAGGYEVWVRNQSGEPVIAGRALVAAARSAG